MNFYSLILIRKNAIDKKYTFKIFFVRLEILLCIQMSIWVSNFILKLSYDIFETI